MNPIKFTSCIVPGSYSTPGLKLCANFDRYFSFSGRVYKVINPTQFKGNYEVLSVRENPNIPLNMLKAISFLSGIIPLIMLLGKLICRNQHKFFLKIKEKSLQTEKPVSNTQTDKPRVSKQIHKATPISDPQMKITKINKNKIPFSTLHHKVAIAIDWLITNRDCFLLEYADFSKCEGFDNECLQKLTKHCPNLKYLDIGSPIIGSSDFNYVYVPKSSPISGDALKYLENTPQLQSLNIFHCDNLDSDSLKYLAYTPELKWLNISECKQLENDALKHLAYTKMLEFLNIARCEQLEKDALKHLANTPELRSLNSMWCDQFEADALKHLAHTLELESLDVGGCTKLAPDALKHLIQTPKLKSLNIEICHGLEKNALRHLKLTPHLEFLNIFWCDQLEADALKHLENTPELQFLNMQSCKQMIPDALKYLANTKNLQSLNIRGCKQLEKDALIHLSQTPKLKTLDMVGCHQLNLKHVLNAKRLKITHAAFT